MQHCSSEDLALASIEGLTPFPKVAGHVGSCPTCRESLHSFQQVVLLLRQYPECAIEAPPPSVWIKVLGELGQLGEVPPVSGS